MMDAFSKIVIGAVDIAKAAIVKIEVLKNQNNRAIPSGSGSGFFFSSDGYLFTNSHVIHGADAIRIMLHVVSVENSSPAQNAGVRDGDFVVAFNDVMIESSDDLFRMLTEEKIGIFQNLTVVRNDVKLDLRITPVEVRQRA